MLQAAKDRWLRAGDVFIIGFLSSCFVHKSGKEMGRNTEALTAVPPLCREK